MVQLWLEILKEITNYAFSSQSHQLHESQQTCVLLHPDHLDLTSLLIQSSWLNHYGGTSLLKYYRLTGPISTISILSFCFLRATS